ncbi:phytochelatin synthase family protein [Tolypothrix sp. FACHB-123]|uniref:phytochelatin synthase family protein n=1 Tax=Tolypothrix sp. FACHB-123 TaxID=2692868 RepID=UPI001685C0B4|nr:phytochelatin synthase family protein [Tolypothrix sp. FACHB-123]MBD2353127.1 phytochelatin synthase family protein [Tolypothrix sp. FACHB-123]
MRHTTRFSQQSPNIKYRGNHHHSRVKQIAITLSSVTGLVSLSGLSIVGYFAFVPPPVKRLPLPENLISLESTVGKKILSESEIRADYTLLNTYFQTQKRPAYCSVASGVMVLNALSKSESISQYLNQQTFFTSATQGVRSPYLVTFLGMTLDDLAALIRSHNRQVQVYHASSITLEQFRNQAKANLKNERDFIIVNYDRSQLGQDGKGHISPLAAYSEKTDKFLILDVSSYKYPPVWVSASTLWKGMNTTDTISQQTRGYLIVRK